MAPPLYTTQTGRLWHAGQILVVTVGVPGRGKTHLAHAIQRYLRWMGVKCNVYNLANVRRSMLGPLAELPEDYFSYTKDNAEMVKLRDQAREMHENAIAKFFEQGGQVAVYDANNSNKECRNMIRDRFSALGVQIMFIECVCDDEEMIERNIRSMHSFNPDYEGWSLRDIKASFRKRIEQHEKVYEPITNNALPHVQLLNFGQRIVVNNVQGYLQNRIVFFLMNIHNQERTIYFARTGESLVEHIYKADAGLSSLGYQYANRLCDFIRTLRSKDRRSRIDDSTTPSQQHTLSFITSSGSTELKNTFDAGGDETRELQVWCSTRKRSQNTADVFRQHHIRVLEMAQLCELKPGVVDGMSEEEILARFPHYREEQANDPYSFRFPRAESYHDLAIRLEPVILELERARKDVLIIGQPSVLRCLIAYLQGNKPQEIPFIQVREGDLVEIRPQAFGLATRLFSFWDPEKERKERDIHFAVRAAMVVSQKDEQDK